MAQKVQIPPDLVGGDVDEGYGKVADAFRRNSPSPKESKTSPTSTATSCASSRCPP
ncbi:hypothetical protein [Mycobacterium montefiorense]|uniref:hypothetical protein n=1 Tax=Mycobacterium montefiorense TaxID=154654 RepID=UPI0021F3147F|nr:hypothetical protein [Mycobacterium montefiorense]